MSQVQGAHIGILYDVFSIGVTRFTATALCANERYEEDTIVSVVLNFLHVFETPLLQQAVGISAFVPGSRSHLHVELRVDLVLELVSK